MQRDRLPESNSLEIVTPPAKLKVFCWGFFGLIGTSSRHVGAGGRQPSSSGSCLYFYPKDGAGDACLISSSLFGFLGGNLEASMIAGFDLVSSLLN